MLSKACIVGIYQKKLEEMAKAASNLELTVAVPPSWRGPHGTTHLECSYTDGYHLSVQRLRFNGSFHLHYYPRLNQLIESVQPDIVHIDEEPYNLATYQAHRLARRTGAKTLWFSWQNLERRYPPPFSWIERYNLRHIDYALVGSHAAARVWRAKGCTAPMAIIPQFGVDPDIFHPPTQSRPPAPTRIAYVGRLVPEKGVDLLLDALSQLTGAWQATVLGSGPEEAKLREKSEVLNLTEHVVFQGFRASTTMPDFYRTVDILVLPSRTQPNWIEQFGRVLIEAMASEVTVVGSETGEIPHVIGDAGRVFPEGDVAALSDTLCELVENPQLRHHLGALGRRRVMRHFTQQQIAEATIAVYKEMLK